MNGKKNTSNNMSSSTNEHSEAIANLGMEPSPKVKGEWTIAKALAEIRDDGYSGNVMNGTPLALFHLLERLKTTKREGWRRFGVDRCESISDHMYRMAMLANFAPAPLRA